MSIVAIALGLKFVLEAVAEATVEPLSWAGVVALHGGVALYLLAEVGVAARTFHRVRTARLTTAIIALLLSWPATLVTPLAVLGGLVALLLLLVVVDCATGADSRRRVRTALRHEEEAQEKAVSRWRQENL